MVRVISEKLFSPPRSRHSSGETVDKELARAVETLAAFNSRRLELSDYESSSDSHWDSEVDIDGDCTESHSRKDLPGGAEGDDGTVSYEILLYSPSLFFRPLFYHSNRSAVGSRTAVHCSRTQRVAGVFFGQVHASCSLCVKRCNVWCMQQVCRSLDRSFMQSHNFRIDH